MYCIVNYTVECSWKWVSFDESVCNDTYSKRYSIVNGWYEQLISPNIIIVFHRHNLNMYFTCITGTIPGNPDVLAFLYPGHVALLTCPSVCPELFCTRFLSNFSTLKLHQLPTPQWFLYWTNLHHGYCLSSPRFDYKLKVKGQGHRVRHGTVLLQVLCTGFLNTECIDIHQAFTRVNTFEAPCSVTFWRSGGVGSQ